MKTRKSAVVRARPKKMTVSTPSRKDIAYDKDFNRWVNEQATFLKKKDFTHLDLDNLIEEIESLAKSDKRALKNNLINLLMHMLKTKYQPEKATKSWQRSIFNARDKIEMIVDDSPSLKREIPTFLDYCYSKARKKAIEETGLSDKTFPDECPWELKEIL